MRQPRPDPWLALLCVSSMACWMLQLGCDADSRSFDEGDDDGSGDSDSDSDTDADSDADTGVDCDGIPWGSGWVVGNPVANLNITGYADQDGDHQVEQEETSFSFEDMACEGHQSVLIVWTDWCST